MYNTTSTYNPTISSTITPQTMQFNNNTHEGAQQKKTKKNNNNNNKLVQLNKLIIWIVVCIRMLSGMKIGGGGI
ncbi:hypothetical protein K457DRAFT_551962 [Linnemannia elongata AG-77]|uniref:Uncharacterized protein n=1 Tax=Linnemannia elongata AG-77 TaxID=1314771 RepID=A0A197JTE2_9FUNG|nr:hypothetical protein K457DRAFT_551962 [Linnemannia elongata AG-77]